MLVMNATDNLRNLIIDKLLTISNQDYLSALYHLIDKNNVENKVIQLSPSQISMLNMSDDDIKNHQVISQEDLDKTDLEWLKSL